MTYETYVGIVAFSPDGRRVVSGDGYGIARVSDAANGQEIACMAHDGPVIDAVFSSDGRRVVSGSENGSVRVWESAGRTDRRCAPAWRTMSL